MEERAGKCAGRAGIHLSSLEFAPHHQGCGGAQDGEMESSQVCFENLLVGPGGQVQGLAQWSSTLLML